MKQSTRYDETSLPVPDLDAVPARYRQRVGDLFDTWRSVRERNARLSTYYGMKNVTKDLGISIPPQLVRTNAVVGWAAKAVKVMAVRSIFDGYVSGGRDIDGLSALVSANRLRTRYAVAVGESLTHGVSFFTVMPGRGGQPAAKVRTFSANQAACLWDKDEDRIGCGVVLTGVDSAGRATRYVCHFGDAVITLGCEHAGPGGLVWSCEAEPHDLGRPMMEPLVYDADDDRPLGHSRITPEVMGIIDKAMRDVLRMEVGAEFFTAPQRYILGATDDLFDPTPLVGDGEGEPYAGPDAWGGPRRGGRGGPGPLRVARGDAPREDSETGDGLDDDDTGGPARMPRADQASMLRTYIGAYLAITSGPNGETPQVGQFPAADAGNFISVFENDAQRFSGATNVPLGQLGVLSNTYTSSDALGAANDPLILDVEQMNARNKETMEEIGRMMAAVSLGVPLSRLPDEYRGLQAYFPDPSRPTLAARADGWTKIGAADKGLVGTRVWYEGLGLPQATIDRIFAETREFSVIETMNAIARGDYTLDSVRLPKAPADG